MTHGTIGEYNFAFFTQLAAVNRQLAYMLIKSESGIGDEEVIPATFTVPTGATPDSPAPSIVANLAAPYLSLIPGVQGQIALNLPIASGTLKVSDVKGVVHSYDLAPVAAPGQPPAPYTIVFNVNLQLAALGASKTTSSAAAVRALADATVGNAFSVQVLFLDFTNANFVEKTSALLPADADLTARMQLEQLMAAYVSMIAGSANPYVLGYALSQGAAPPPVTQGPFAPAAVDFSLTSDGTVSPGPTLDYWVVTAGTSAPTAQDKQQVSGVQIDPQYGGLIVLGGNVLMAPILASIESQTSCGALNWNGSSWTNGATFDSRHDKYDCLNVKVAPSGGSLRVTYTYDKKSTSSTTIGIPHFPKETVSFWGSANWTRTDTIAFACGTQGSLETTFTKGSEANQPTTKSGSNASGAIVDLVTSIISHFVNDLLKGVQVILNLASINVSVPSVNLVPSVGGFSGFKGPRGQTSSVPFLMPTGNVVVPANPRFDGLGNLMLDAPYNSGAS